MRTMVIRVERPKGSSDYRIRAELIDGQHVLAKVRRSLRVPEEETTLVDDHSLHALAQAVLDELLAWHSCGQQLSLY